MIDRSRAHTRRAITVTVGKPPAGCKQPRAARLSPYARTGHLLRSSRLTRQVVSAVLRLGHACDRERAQGNRDTSDGAVRRHVERPGLTDPHTGTRRHAPARTRRDGHDCSQQKSKTPPEVLGLSTESDGRSRRAGLPHQHLPLSEFLTLSAVFSRRILVALFHATSAHRLSGPSELFPPEPAVMPLDIRCSLAIRLCGAARAANHLCLP